MTWNKRQMWVIFKFKMGCKAAEAIRNIKNSFGPGIANKHTVQRCFKKFCKGDEILEDEETRGWPSEVDKDRWGQPSKLIVLQLHEKLLKNSTLSLLWSFGIWNKLERWKSSVSGCLTRWPQIKKLLFGNIVFSYPTQQCTVSQPDCDAWQEDFLWQPATTRPVAGLRRGSEALLKAQLAPNKKAMVSVWWSAAGLIHHSFLNPGETTTSEKCAQQIDEMHRILWHLQPALVSRMAPDLLCDHAWPHFAHQTHQKLNELGYKVLPHPPHSPDLSPTDYHFFKHLDLFLQGKCFHNQQEAWKTLSQSSSNPHAWIFMLRE